MAKSYKKEHFFKEGVLQWSLSTIYFISVGAGVITIDVKANSSLTGTIKICYSLRENSEKIITPL